MLSKAELDYLRAPQQFHPNYAKVLKHRLRVKVESLREELQLLADAGYLQAAVTSECNGVTRICNSQQGLNQAANREAWCGRRDLNPGRRRGRPMS